jgi:hypothetical protein
MSGEFTVIHIIRVYSQILSSIFSIAH